MNCDILNSIGNTPLLSLPRLGRELGLAAELWVKREAANPGGSIKDRAALFMLRGARERGELREGATVLEATSGNTGIGLALVCAAYGHPLVIFMPDSMSPERSRLMASYGAQLRLTPGAEGMAGAVRRMEACLAESPGSWTPSQFANPDNVLAHYRGTGPEIWAQSGGRVDVFVSTIGTGGTLTGTGRFLREQSPALRIIGVEPAESPLLTQGIAGPHRLQGIGANFVPALLDRSLPDEILTVSGEEAQAMARRLARTEGLLVGWSGGAAVAAAAGLAAGPDMTGRRIVTILPDSGERYLSTELFA